MIRTAVAQCEQLRVGSVDGDNAIPNAGSVPQMFSTATVTAQADDFVLCRTRTSLLNAFMRYTLLAGTCVPCVDRQRRFTALREDSRLEGTPLAEPSSAISPRFRFAQFCANSGNQRVKTA